jgi:ribonuclease HI
VRWVPLRALNADLGLVVYTDGSCSHLDKLGAWAWVAVDLIGNAHQAGRAIHDTTISRMELQAACEALDALYDEFGPLVILLYSDSEYLVKGINEPSRKRNKNVDMWLWLEEARAKHTLVEFEHTRGHAGNEGNEAADKLAGEMRLGAKYSDCPLAQPL